MLSRQTESIDQVQEALQQELYIAERNLATSIYLALKLGKPLLVEGEAGVGKTEIAKVLASMLGCRLIRLQCYEGLDVNTAVYEWNYTRQMLEIRLLEATGQVDEKGARRQIFSPEFLLKRPLLQAIDHGEGPEPVLLIDELDRADEEFEAFLLEILSDFQEASLITTGGAMVITGAKLLARMRLRSSTLTPMSPINTPPWRPP